MSDAKASVRPPTKAATDATRTILLGEIAAARSGDKGADANVGVIARTPGAYKILRAHLTAAKVEAFFKPMGVTAVVRYDLPNLGALNFILRDILDGGGSLSLRIDAQGKALGQAILEMPLEISPAELADALPDAGATA